MNDFVVKSILIISLVVLIPFQGIMQESKPKKTETPNVVLILVDDMGYGDVGCFGATRYSTPNIDRLASNGMRFTNFYAAQPICSASRAALLSGCYSNRVGIAYALNPEATIGINPDEELIPEILAHSGYKNCIVGKWHLGNRPPLFPLQNGFDEYFGLPYSNDMWSVGYDRLAPKPIDSQSMNPPLIKGNDKIGEINSFEEQDKLTTSYTEYAIDFINRNKKNPFFLYFAHSMVHVPLGVSDKFKGKSDQGAFGDVVMELDWSVGEIMKTLEDNNLTENTLVIFTSDNGPWMNFGDHAGSAGGLREGKEDTYEGGVRVPCIMNWPGVIPEGTICNKIASTIDILPTLANISGSPLPTKQIDGVNIFPLLEGDTDANPRDHFFYYFQKNDLEAVRKGNWKLVFPHKYRSYIGVMPGQNGMPGEYNWAETGLALYDMRRDPGERYDVKEQYPEIVKELEELAQQAREDLGDDLTGMPGKNRRQPGQLKINN
ncbi:sulfatase family protein [Sunxiuqinia sp. A32]|uniref:sulfatase family protein n=1 Tax=Sunxiuqinia sp. A32 TaxID=3461496 RepID=UPI0040463DCE